MGQTSSSSYDPQVVIVRQEGGCTGGQCVDPCGPPRFEVDPNRVDPRLFQAGLRPQVYQEVIGRINSKFASRTCITSHRQWFIWIVGSVTGMVFFAMIREERVECDVSATCELNLDRRGYVAPAGESADNPKSCCAYYCCDGEPSERLLEESASQVTKRSRLARAFNRRPMGHAVASGSWMQRERRQAAMDGQATDFSETREVLDQVVSFRGLSVDVTTPAQCKVHEKTERSKCFCEKGRNKKKEQCGGTTKILGPHTKHDAVIWPLALAILFNLVFVGVPGMWFICFMCGMKQTIPESLNKAFNEQPIPANGQFHVTYEPGGKHSQAYIKIRLPVSFASQSPMVGQPVQAQPISGQIMQGLDPASGKVNYYQMQPNANGQLVPVQLSAEQAQQIGLNPAAVPSSAPMEQPNDYGYSAADYGRK
ncbi:unnamed protein product [Amoebophrya sp. A25]|nr:unnamed protein product [Amoebophrya sp. A25]|eukprot:GSA25T00015285001.1